jgi:membrane protein implicated in regulation of membrane protease activity
MPAPLEQPSWRKPVGVLLILALIAAWAIIMLIFTPIIVALAWPLQALFFAIFGIAWIVPLKPLLRWMERSRERD